MNYFVVPDRWQISESAFRLSMAEMAIDGAYGREGVAMWLGMHEQGTASVSHVAVLRGRGVLKARDQLHISSDLLNELTDKAIEIGITLLGQIHSHGPMHGTSLSVTDKRYGIAVPGYLSAVAPSYATNPATTLADCGVHLFEQPSGWRRLSADEVAKRIDVSNAVPIQSFVVGSYGRE